jgi:hypothetical protein
MVEKIIINPEKIRAYGNIIKTHIVSDYLVDHSFIAKSTAIINNIQTTVFNLTYSLYGFVFGFDNERLYLINDSEADISFGFDSENERLYLTNNSDENVYFGFDSTNERLYIGVD